jgi:hypothetical protein
VPPLIDLTGQRFGRLVVLERDGTRSRRTTWLCQCECGNTHVTTTSYLRSDAPHSCGCLVKEKRERAKWKHGQYGTRLYHIWDNMKRRCNSSQRPDFFRYGGRGITLCSEWFEFRPFYDWAIANGYNDRLQIDRADNNKGYSPDNCRWVTGKANCRNKRTNRFITYNGEIKTLKDWSEILGINYRTLRKRLGKCGWSIEKAFTTPIDRRYSHARGAHK